MPVNESQFASHMASLDNNQYVGITAINTGYPAPQGGYYDASRIGYVKLDPRAKPPSVSQEGDVAADLFALEDTVIPARGRALVHTGITFNTPRGFRESIRSRSGLSLKKGIEAGAGLIDNSFRREIGIVLHNHTDEDIIIERGMAAAQICFERWTYPILEEDTEVTQSTRTEGWGSSGR